MLHLHTVPTANGFKASIMLEETGLPYQVRRYDLQRGEHLGADYLAMNPVGRLPLLVDDDQRRNGLPLQVYGTAAILLYLAERTGRFLPQDPLDRAVVYQWLGMISSDLAPAYTGQFVFTVLAPEKLAWAIGHYERLCLRMLQPLELQLATSEYLAGPQYTIADIIAYPVAAVSVLRYPGTLDAHPNLARWAATVGARPAVQRGMQVGLA